MSAETADWQNRTRLLTGDEGMDRLSRAHVLVIGLGGVGGIAAEMIARAGIGKMTIADGDVFEASNRNRQIGALLSTAGRSKTEVMAERLRDIHPELVLETVNAYLKNETMTALLDQAPYDCVLDAIDSLSPKVQLLCHCVRKKIPVISCMGSGARLDPELVRCADISKTEHCTLARAVRHKLKKEGITRGIPVIFSPEDPVPGSVIGCNETEDGKSVMGTISYMPAIFGCHCAAAVIRTLLNGCDGTCRQDCV